MARLRPARRVDRFETDASSRHPGYPKPSSASSNLPNGNTEAEGGTYFRWAVYGLVWDPTLTLQPRYSRPSHLHVFPRKWDEYRAALLSIGIGSLTVHVPTIK